MTHPHQNALHAEASPYLRQHATNPVQWLPWGEAAFERARREDKPILLSIGYAACHWCHVMARESFEDAAVAQLMNEHFVNIKVDREERPDVDAVYIQALQAMGKRAGWPLTIFLTPDGEPYWGGTYFPPIESAELPAFRDVLTRVSEVYRSDRRTVKERAAGIVASLQQASRIAAGGDFQHADTVAAAEALLRDIDPEHGGLRGAPKFPYVPLLRFLWSTGRRRGRNDFQRAVTVTVDNMIRGGLYDHLGGGFSRYSVDAEWRIPHFEKMLYDNAQLVSLLSEVWTATRAPEYEDCVRRTVEWLLREMALPQGGFASSFAAESEGGEGAYYVWTEEELDSVLGDRADFVKRVYGVTRGGNFEGRNVLNRLAVHSPLNAEQGSLLAAGREALFRARSLRTRPLRDDKVLADWNGMAIFALSKAGVMFREASWLAAAEKAFDFVVSRMMRDGQLCHSWCDGEAGSASILDDYASMAKAALALFEVTGSRCYLGACERWVSVCNAQFRDAGSGVFYFTADDARLMPARMCEGRDQATPSGNGVLAEVLARLYYLTGREGYRDAAHGIVRAFERSIEKEGYVFATVLDALQFTACAAQIVIVGEHADPATRSLCETAHLHGGPDSVVSVVAPGVSLPPSHPAAGKHALDGEPTAYVCVGTTCLAPARDSSTLQATLSIASS
ncbi:MAG: thioredoxin domain-containing protein [Betaproteobacteria bacterium]